MGQQNAKIQLQMKRIGNNKSYKFIPQGLWFLDLGSQRGRGTQVQEHPAKKAGERDLRVGGLTWSQLEQEAQDKKRQEEDNDEGLVDCLRSKIKLFNKGDT